MQQMISQLPQANAMRQGPYQVRCRLKAGEATSVVHAVYEIESYDEDEHEYIVVRPTEDSLPYAQLVIGAGHTVEAGNPFMASQVTDALTAAADTGQTVAVGDDIGTQADSYRLKVDNTGFKALGYDTTEGSCLVRPFSSSVGASYQELYIEANTMVSGLLGSNANSAPVYSTEYTLLDNFVLSTSGWCCSPRIRGLYFNLFTAGTATQMDAQVALQMYRTDDSQWVDVWVSPMAQATGTGLKRIVSNSLTGFDSASVPSGSISSGTYTKARFRFALQSTGDTGSYTALVVQEDGAMGITSVITDPFLLRVYFGVPSPGFYA